MKLFLFFLTGVVLSFGCVSKKKAIAKCYEGRLEVKANCMNYTVAVLSQIDSSLVQSFWVDDHTGKEYKNVFALASRCSFPKELKEGDRFYFTIDTSLDENCAVCMMYYPVPSKRLMIKVLNAPCP